MDKDEKNQNTTKIKGTSAAEAKEDFLYMDIKAKIVDEIGLKRIITRISHEILERNKGSKNIVLMGMRTRGEFLAKGFMKKLKKLKTLMFHLEFLMLLFTAMISEQD